MKDIIIFDLDGTISDDSWRVVHRYKGEYDTYHNQLGFDEPMNWKLTDFDQTEFEPVILTTRPEKYRSMTLRWLRRNKFPKWSSVCLLMRPNGNLLPSPELKQQMVFWLIVNYRFGYVKMAYDDRGDIIEMYKSLGIPAKKVTYESARKLGNWGKNLPSEK